MELFPAIRSSAFRSIVLKANACFQNNAFGAATIGARGQTFGDRLFDVFLMEHII